MTVGGMRHYTTYRAMITGRPAAHVTGRKVVGRDAELTQSARAARIGWGSGGFLGGQRATCEERTGGESFLVRRSNVKKIRLTPNFPYRRGCGACRRFAGRDLLGSAKNPQTRFFAVGCVSSGRGYVAV